MIGMSLAYKKLVATDDPQLKPAVLLPRLWEHGVRSIELRGFSTDASPVDAVNVAHLLWDYGFQLTVHSKVRSLQTAVKDVFEPLSLILNGQMRQRELILTVHPIVGDNVSMLTALSDHITEHGYPVRIALENNRLMPDASVGDSVALVLDAVTRADRRNVGICFDMGHWAWYTANYTETPNLLPPKEFLQKVIHTHIHAYRETATNVYGAVTTKGATHFPLEEYREPISLYIDALGYRYLGVYNVELSPARFADYMSATEAYLTSADTLASNYPNVAAHHDEMRLHYDTYFHHSLAVLDKKEGCYGTLIAPTAYVFSTNGYQWGMDLSFRELYDLAESPSRVREHLGGLGCVMITHSHSDHMEARTIHALSDTDITWVAPEFLVEKLLSFGVRRERITAVCAGDTVCVGPLQIRVLEGRHFRPGTRSGVDAVGYLVSAEHAPTLAFPGDVRDYGVEDGEGLQADHCFGHVWLTDNAFDPTQYVPKSREFAEFVLSHSQRSILLTHLYISRTEDKRWTLHHAHVAREAILARSPQTVVRVPRYGEVIDLSCT